jgi:hypothetical protein
LFRKSYTKQTILTYVSSFRLAFSSLSWHIRDLDEDAVFHRLGLDQGEDDVKQTEAVTQLSIAST